MSREENGKKVIVCRCRDVTEREVKEAIAEGYDTMELVKRRTKIGTGTCGGRTCLPLVQRILGRETGREVEEIRLPRETSPIVPLPIRFAAGEKAGV
ncbi:MAG: (2Fe-2S)-binding protein, partial [Candidatus Bipolaricaulia bacterium]